MVLENVHGEMIDAMELDDAKIHLVDRFHSIILHRGINSTHRAIKRAIAKKALEEEDIDPWFQ